MKTQKKPFLSSERTRSKKDISKPAEIRQAIADYMQSEGCDCCRDIESHKEHTKRIAKLLGVPKYSDGSGYNFNKFATKPTRFRGDEV